MKSRVLSLAVLAVWALLPATANASDLPAIKTSERNAVPECATPGRMMAFLRARNDALDPRFEKIAVDYMRYGEQLGMRWDYAFFQMAIETGYLTFTSDGKRPGLVRSAQNNFAGLGAVGRGQHGESFKDVATGVQAHLQHVLLYAGAPVDNPVAERTRKVNEWGVLKSWQSKIKTPITYAQLAEHWASSSRYADAIETHAELFYENFCNTPDPDPALVQEARGITVDPTAQAEVASAPEKSHPGPTGVELARKAIEDGKAEDNNTRVGLGAGFLARLAGSAKPAASGNEAEGVTAPDTAVPDTALQETAPAQGQPMQATTGQQQSISSAAGKGKTAKVQTVSAAGGMAQRQVAAPPVAPAKPVAKCKVWTASYGGPKAVLIRAQSGSDINYTVLDVNEGAEKREAEAYIAAYAKGGSVAAEFQSPSVALEKAFELCPEG